MTDSQTHNFRFYASLKFSSFYSRRAARELGTSVWWHHVQSKHLLPLWWCKLRATDVSQRLNDPTKQTAMAAQCNNINKVTLMHFIAKQNS